MWIFFSLPFFKNNTCSPLQRSSSLQWDCSRFFRANRRVWLKAEREKSKETDAVIKDVLMDWYEEVVVEVSPDKQHTFKMGDGWLIHHCSHETPALCLCRIIKNKNWDEFGRTKRLLGVHYCVDMVCLMSGQWELNLVLNSLSVWGQVILTESKVTGFTGWWWLLLNNVNMYFETCLTFESSFIIRLNVCRYLCLMYLSNGITLACGI